MSPCSSSLANGNRTCLNIPPAVVGGDAVSFPQAWEYRLPIYLGAAAAAEFVADVFLCPLEATRIRLVSDPTYADGLVSAVPKILRQEGVIRGFYSGFAPILFKQIPYTMAKFAVQVRVCVFFFWHK